LEFPKGQSSLRDGRPAPTCSNAARRMCSLLINMTMMASVLAIPILQAYWMLRGPQRMQLGSMGPKHPVSRPEWPSVRCQCLPGDAYPIRHPGFGGRRKRSILLRKWRYAVISDAMFSTGWSDVSHTRPQIHQDCFRIRFVAIACLQLPAPVRYHPLQLKVATTPATRIVNPLLTIRF
jgi:hypothetical protein